MVSDKTIYVTLHSKDGIYNDGHYRFNLTHSLNLHGYDVIMEMTQYHGLNNVPNIQNDLTFFDRTLSAGFYTTEDIQIFLQTVLNLTVEPKVNCYFDKSVLKFRFISDAPFTINGSILTFLGFPEEVITSLPISGRFDFYTGQTFGNENEIFMTNPLGLYRDIEYIHVLNKSLLCKPHVSGEGDFENEIAKIPLKVAFGSYIVLDHGDIGIQNQLFNKNLQTIDLSIVTDNNFQIQTLFSLTMKLSLYKNNETHLNNIRKNYVVNSDTTNDEEGEIGEDSQYLGDYSIVRIRTGKLKDARKLYAERLLNKRKEFMLNHPFYQFTEDELDELKKKWDLMKKALQKRKKK